VPLTIDRAAVSMDIADESRAAPAQPLTDAELRARLRPIVLEILSAEIERLRREQG
jgi:hypothetical protein